MRKYSRLSMVLVISVILLSFVLVSCTRPENGEIGQEEPENKLVRADIYGDPENLDPILKDKTSSLVLNRVIFERLVEYDIGEGKFKPALAVDWEVSSDGLTYTFELRQGAKFHNGREIIADDVKYSFERLLDPDNMSPAGSTLSAIKGAKDFIEGNADEVVGIEVTDYAVKITLDQRDPVFMNRLAMVCCSIVPKEEVEELKADFGMKPVGSGPYKFDSWTKDSKVVLVANPDHWAGAPQIDVVETLILKEESTRVAMFESGQIDYMVVTDPLYLKYKNDPQWADNLIEVPELFTRHIAFNCEKPPFDKKLVRQAICHAIDGPTLIETLLQGKAYPATGIFPPSLSAYDPDLKGLEYDPDKARALLEEAGYPDGFEFEIICTDSSAWGLPVVEAIQPYLERMGITMRPVLAEWGVMIDRANSGDFEAYMYSVCGEPHPYQWLLLFHTDSAGGAGNRMRYSNPEVDDLIDRMVTATSEEEMIDLARQAQRIIVEDAPWWCFNYNKAVLVHHPWVKGLVGNPMDIDYQPFHEMSLEGKPK